MQQLNNLRTENLAESTEVLSNRADLEKKY